jgi:signal transduction histidine kinase
MALVSALIVSPQPGSTHSLEQQLVQLGMRPLGSAATLAEATALLAQLQPQVIVADLCSAEPDVERAVLALAEEQHVGVVLIVRPEDRLALERSTPAPPPWCVSWPPGDEALRIAVEAAAALAQARRQLEAQQGMIVLGSVVGGVAHEFNNMLTSIAGNADLALLDIAPGTETRVSVEQIQASVRRATLLTRQLLMLAGRVRAHSPTFDLATVVREMTPLLVVGAGKRVGLRIELDEAPALIRADAGRVRNLVLAMVVEAAILAGDGELLLRVHALQAGAALEVRYPAQTEASGPADFVATRAAARSVEATLVLLVSADTAAIQVQLSHG